MAWRDIDIGAVSAYAVAVERGYTGTEEEWARDQANAAINAGIARESAESAKADAEAAKAALNSLAPDTDKALAAISSKGAEQVKAVQDAGAEQVKAVQDAGAEQSRTLEAQGDVERRKVVAAGDAQVERVASEGAARVQSITDAEAEAVEAVNATAAENKQDVAEIIQAAKDAAEAEIADKGAEVLASIPDDYKALAESAERAAPAIVIKAESQHVAVEDAADGRVFMGLTVYGRGVQNGTPNPESPAMIITPGADGETIVRVCGKNLFPGGAVSQVTYTGSDGAQTTRWGYAIRLPAGTYTLWAIKQEGASDKHYLYGSVNDAEGKYTGNAKLVGGAVLFTQVITVEQGDVIYLYNGNTDGLQSDSAPSQQCFDEYAVHIVAGTATVDGDLAVTGGSVTVATPDGLCSIPVTTGGNYTDDSGQMWLADEIDLVRGVHTQRIGKVVLDGVTTGKMATSKSSNTNINTYNVSTDTWGRAIGADVALVLSHYTYNGTADGSSHVKKDGVMLCNVPGSMYAGHDSITTLEDYNAWLAAQHAAGTPVTVLYPLAEPVETPLTSSELAAANALRSVYQVTNIVAEGAWIRAAYIADTKTYIDNKLAAIAASIINA